jgi:serine/alanine racemase
MRAKSNYGGLDLFRLLAAMLVIAIHISPLTSLSTDADFFLTRILGRVAVPFFFMVTGQFVVSEFLSPAQNKTNMLKKCLKKVAILYGIAILIYLPFGIYAGHYHDLTVGSVLRMLVFDGTFYHLWYFPACIIGILIVFLLSRFLNLYGMSIAAGVLYLIGLFGDSYFGLIKDVPVIAVAYQHGFRIFSYTRNGLFLAPIFLILGAWIGRKKPSAKPFANIFGLVVSFLLMTAEAFTLHHFHLQRHDSMYLCLIPTMVFLYQILLAWQRKPSKRFRVIATWIYILHPAMIVIIRAIAKVLHMTGLFIDNRPVQYLSVAILSIIASFLLSILLERPQKEVFHCNRAWIELSRTALTQNVAFLRSRLPKQCKLMPAVKADAYGHGAVLIAKELNRLGVDAFCVACVAEGVTLRMHGIRGEILILGYTPPKQFPLLRRYHLIQTVVDYSYALELNRYGKRVHVHIGIDTGMHRLGERSENIDRLCAIFEMKTLMVDGIFTHLCADDTETLQDREFTEGQANAFFKLIKELENRGYHCPKIHLQSSYGVLNYPELAKDYARVGIAIYGVLSTKEDTKVWEDALQPVLSLKARVATVKNLYAGEAAGYGMQFIAEHDMRIATIAIGYADGFPRSLSNGNGAVLIQGHKAPIIGRICMDQTIVDVSEIPGVKAGDIVLLIGKSGNQEISACDLANQDKTITNELLSRLGARLERIVT